MKAKFAIRLVALSVLFATSSAVAEPSPFGPVDSALINALKDSEGKSTLQYLATAEDALEAANQTRTRNAQTADLDVNVRAALIDAMKDITVLEANGNTLETVRGMVKSLDLARSLWEAAGVGQANKTPELDQLVSSYYSRLSISGAKDRNAPLAFGASEDEKLIFRTFSSDQKGRVSAFELIGRPAERRAIWRETPRAIAAPQILSGLTKLLPRSIEPALPVQTFPFLLVLSERFAPDLKSEVALRSTLDTLLKGGVIVVAAPAHARPLPFTLVPTLAHDVGEESVQLVYRPTNAVLYSSREAASPKLLNKHAELASALAAEVNADLNRSAAEITFEPSIGMLLAKPVEVSSGENDPALAVQKNVEAVSVESGRLVTVESTTPIKLRAVLGGDWGQYELPEAADVIWLRQEIVGAYREPSKETKDGTVNDGESTGFFGKLLDWGTGAPAENEPQSPKQPNP